MPQTTSSKTARKAGSDNKPQNSLFGEQSAVASRINIAINIAAIPPVLVSTTLLLRILSNDAYTGLIKAGVDNNLAYAAVSSAGAGFVVLAAYCIYFASKNAIREAGSMLRTDVKSQ